MATASAIVIFKLVTSISLNMFAALMIIEICEMYVNAFQKKVFNALLIHDDYMIMIILDDQGLVS